MNAEFERGVLQVRDATVHYAMPVVRKRGRKRNRRSTEETTAETEATPSQQAPPLATQGPLTPSSTLTPSQLRGHTPARSRGSDDRVLAVDRASFQVVDGEIIALTGPSGCGKSTLLRAVAGLEPLSRGSVHWNESDISRMPPHRRGFGLMFQDGQLFGHLSVAGNIAYGLRAQHVAREAREQRVHELLELVGLPGFGERAVHELSGGQRQRVALARSLAPQPRLLLLDEPLSALDRGLRERLATDLARLLRQTGTSAILVTHDEGEADLIADRQIRMSDGKLLN